MSKKDEKSQLQNWVKKNELKEDWEPLEMVLLRLRTQREAVFGGRARGQSHEVQRPRG